MDSYVAELVAVFREVRRVLRPDGTLWLNLGDAHANDGKWGGASGGKNVAGMTGAEGFRVRRHTGLKPKDLFLMPARVALALQADGWWLRQDIVWCLSGGTWIWARVAGVDRAMMLKDLVRCDPATVQLWNGRKWTRAVGWSRVPRAEGEVLEIEFRNGQRVGCTRGHYWPTLRGNVQARDLIPGDVVEAVTLPEPAKGVDEGVLCGEVAWVAGYYLANGSRSGGGLVLSCHADKAAAVLARVAPLAARWGASARSRVTRGRGAVVTLYGAALVAAVMSYITGDSAKTKGLSAATWQHSAGWLRAFAEGYFAGDGHWEEASGRWRLGFARNDRLASDLRVLAARLGARVTLMPRQASAFGRKWPCYRGWWRWQSSDHWNTSAPGEVVRIRRSRGRCFWDVEVADDPHVFALASGLLTHNSKSAAMPESVADRPSSAMEHVFLLAASERYFYDAHAIAEPLAAGAVARLAQDVPAQAGTARANGGERAARPLRAAGGAGGVRNARNVWTLPPEACGDQLCQTCGRFWRGRDLRGLRRVVLDGVPVPVCRCGSASGWLTHFAVMPSELARRCISAGTSEGGGCAACGAPFRRVLEAGAPDVAARAASGADASGGYGGVSLRQPGAVGVQDASAVKRRVLEGMVERRTVGWRPSCSCGAAAVPQRVLDPFGGAGTTALAARRLGRACTLVELHPGFAALARARVSADAPLLEAAE